VKTLKTTDRIFMKIIPQMSLWTKKSLLNFGSYPDAAVLGRRSAFSQLDIWQRGAVAIWWPPSAPRAIHAINVSCFSAKVQPFWDWGCADPSQSKTYFRLSIARFVQKIFASRLWCCKKHQKSSFGVPRFGGGTPPSHFGHIFQIWLSLVDLRSLTSV